MTIIAAICCSTKTNSVLSIFRTVLIAQGFTTSRHYCVTVIIATTRPADHYLGLFLQRSPYFDAAQFVSLKRAFDLTAIQRQLKAPLPALAPTRRQEQPPGMDRACAAPRRAPARTHSETKPEPAAGPNYASRSQKDWRRCNEGYHPRSRSRSPFSAPH